jgi:hypothetical protein
MGFGLLQLGRMQRACGCAEVVSGARVPIRTKRFGGHRRRGCGGGAGAGGMDLCQRRRAAFAVFRAACYRARKTPSTLPTTTFGYAERIVCVRPTESAQIKVAHTGKVPPLPLVSCYFVCVWGEGGSVMISSSHNRSSSEPILLPPIPPPLKTP